MAFFHLIPHLEKQTHVAVADCSCAPEIMHLDNGDTVYVHEGITEAYADELVKELLRDNLNKEI